MLYIAKCYCQGKLEKEFETTDAAESTKTVNDWVDERKNALKEEGFNFWQTSSEKRLYRIIGVNEKQYEARAIIVCITEQTDFKDCDGNILCCFDEVEPLECKEEEKPRYELCYNGVNFYLWRLDRREWIECMSYDDAREKLSKFRKIKEEEK